MFSEGFLSFIMFNVSYGIRGNPNGVCGGGEGELPSGCARRQNRDPTEIKVGMTVTMVYPINTLSK